MLNIGNFYSYDLWHCIGKNMFWTTLDDDDDDDDFVI